METAGNTLMKFGVMPRYNPCSPSVWTMRLNTEVMRGSTNPPFIIAIPGAPPAVFNEITENK